MGSSGGEAPWTVDFPFSGVLWYSAITKIIYANVKSAEADLGYPGGFLNWAHATALDSDGGFYLYHRWFLSISRNELPERRGKNARTGFFWQR